MTFKLYEQLATESDCYKANRKTEMTGIVVHSTGANNPYLQRYVQPDDGYIGKNIYNNSVNRPGLTVIAHAYIGKDKNGDVKCYQAIPFDIACWSAGSGVNGSYNYNPTGRIQFEICEDGLEDAEYFDRAFNCAAEFCAYLCKLYGWSVDKICSHKEANLAGYASNHGDPENWLSKFGRDMDWFRQSVKELLGSPVDTPTEDLNIIYRVQTGAFAKRENAQAMVDKLNGLGFEAFIVSVKKQ